MKKEESLLSLIQSKGLTQREFANRVGVHESNVSYWLKERHTPSIKHVTTMSKVLGTSIENILQIFA